MIQQVGDGGENAAPVGDDAEPVEGIAGEDEEMAPAGNQPAEDGAGDDDSNHDDDSDGSDWDPDDGITCHLLSSVVAVFVGVSSLI